MPLYPTCEILHNEHNSTNWLCLIVCFVSTKIPRTLSWCLFVTKIIASDHPSDRFVEFPPNRAYLLKACLHNVFWENISEKDKPMINRLPMKQKVKSDYSKHHSEGFWNRQYFNIQGIRVEGANIFVFFWEYGLYSIVLRAEMILYPCTIYMTLSWWQSFDYPFSSYLATFKGQEGESSPLPSFRRLWLEGCEFEGCRPVLRATPCFCVWASWERGLSLPIYRWKRAEFLGFSPTQTRCSSYLRPISARKSIELSYY